MVCGIEDKGRAAKCSAKDVHVGHDFAESEVRMFMDNGASR
jgi:hypothetical protein